MTLLILIGILAAILFFFISVYNGLITARNRFKNAFAQVDVQLQQRYDKIPNLVETAKGYMAHERETLEAVIAARGAAVSGLAAAKSDPGAAGAMQQLSSSNGALNQSLGRLMLVAEQYPDLKANQLMAQLSEELITTENKVGFARQAYNDAVMDYNNKREVFPNSFVANMSNFTAATPFEVESAEVRKAVKVSFAK